MLRNLTSAFARCFAKQAVWILLILLCGSSSLFGQGYPPREAAARMDVLEGFSVQLLAAEPQVRQPVAVDVDDRGRLWVLQYLQYPNPAGLKRVKVDRYSRTTYDRIPAPPPHGPKGADRLTILTDQDGDGICETATDFVDGLNLATGFAFGHGGVFVLQTPYLLFYPDRNQDDVPDSDPEVLLRGFGMEDSSSLANSLIFGPDGWLYGTQGTNNTARIRGIEFQQGVWRYHPVTRRFELFCEGGGNAWGLDFDEEGNLFFSTNYGGYLMHHGVQGAYYEKSFAKHGELHNAFAFGWFPHVPHTNFQGGHVTVGGLVYQSAAFPEPFRGRYMAVDTLGHAVRFHDIRPDGSTFTTEYAGTFLNANDTWFAPSDLTRAPDGSLIFSDWHDRRTAHPDPDAEWDRSNGRIFRLRYRNQPLWQPFDLTALSSDELTDRLSSPNHWMAVQARRILSERRDLSVVPKLNRMLRSDSIRTARQALWTLAGMGVYDSRVPVELTHHRDDVVCAWSIRFLGDRFSTESDASPPEVTSAWENRLVELAARSSSRRVLSQLACTARRLPAPVGLKVVRTLSAREDVPKDRYLPLLIWWAVEQHAIDASSTVLAQFADESGWRNSLIRKEILPRLMKRFAGDGSGAGFRSAATLLNSTPDDDQFRHMLHALDDGLKLVGREPPQGLPPGTAFEGIAVRKPKQPGRRRGLAQTPPELRDVVRRCWNRQTKDPLILRVLSRLGHRPALSRTVELAADPTLPSDRRLEMLSILEELAGVECVDSVLRLLDSEQDPQLTTAALKVLRRFPSPLVTRRLLELYTTVPDTVRPVVQDVLVSHPDSALALLKEIDAGRLPEKDIGSDHLKLLAAHESDAIDAIVHRHWGRQTAGTPEERLAEIRRLMNDLRAGSGDSGRGRELFRRHCASCHTLFGEGRRIGPDLTQANRQDRLYLLTSLVDPSSRIRREYLRYVVVSTSGRIVIGLLADDSATEVTLLTEKNQRIRLQRDEIDSMQVSETSLMPENLLKTFSPQDVRDLFAWLQETSPDHAHSSKGPQP